MQSPERAKVRMRATEEEPRAPRTGETCFDIQVYDAEGNWLGSGGVYPLRWITLTEAGLREDETEFKKFFRAMQKTT